jgi:hypothetical protein
MVYKLIGGKERFFNHHDVSTFFESPNQIAPSAVF